MNWIYFSCYNYRWRQSVRFYITVLIILKYIKLNTLFLFRMPKTVAKYMNSRLCTQKNRSSKCTESILWTESNLPHLTPPSWTICWRPLSSQMLQVEYFSLNIAVLCPLCKAVVTHSSWLDTDNTLEHWRYVSVLELSLFNVCNKVFQWLLIAKWSNMKMMKNLPWLHY